MSTCNFEPMEYGMPLVCGGLGYYEDYKECYEEEFGEEYTEDMFYFDLDCEFDNARILAEKFSDDLKYHKVSVQSGYYQGFQFIVNELYDNMFDLDKESPYCIDNEDANYYFGMCRSKVLRSADAEKRKINKWLEEMGKMGGFEILVCGGVFSNGEAIYYKRDSAKTA